MPNLTVEQSYTLLNLFQIQNGERKISDFVTLDKHAITNAVLIKDLTLQNNTHGVALRCPNGWWHFRYDCYTMWKWNFKTMLAEPFNIIEHISFEDKI